MKKLIFLLLITQFSLAAYITPELRRDRKNLNNSATGTVWQERNGAGAQAGLISGDSEDSDGTKIYDVNGAALNGYGFYYNDQFSLEGSGTLTKGTLDYESSNIGEVDIDQDSIALLAGFKLNENIGLGFSYGSSTQQFNINDSVQTTTDSGFSVGTSIKIKNHFFIGAGFEALNNETETLSSTRTEIDYNRYFVGVGYQNLEIGKDGYAFELLYRFQPDEINGTTSVDRLNDIIFNGIYAYQKFQVDSELVLTTGENATGTTDYDNLVFDLELEFLVNPNVYFLGGFRLTYEEESAPADLEETEGLAYSLGAGYRNQNWDISLIVGFVNSEDIENGVIDNEDKSQTVALNAAYFF